MLSVTDAKKVIDDLQKYPFICSDTEIVTESKYVIMTQKEYERLVKIKEHDQERQSMSDLIIKGMEMPKHAVRNGTDDTMYRSCVLVHPDGTAELVVDLEFADKFNFKHSLKRFPIIEIPTPHGELLEEKS